MSTKLSIIADQMGYTDGTCSVPNIIYKWEIQSPDPCAGVCGMWRSTEESAFNDAESLFKDIIWPDSIANKYVRVGDKVEYDVVRIDSFISLRFSHGNFRCSVGPFHSDSIKGKLKEIKEELEQRIIEQKQELLVIEQYARDNNINLD